MIKSTEKIQRGGRIMRLRGVSFFFAMMVFFASCIAGKEWKPDTTIKAISDTSIREAQEKEDIAELEKLEMQKLRAEKNIRQLKDGFFKTSIALYRVYVASTEKNLFRLCRYHAGIGDAKAVAWCCKHHYLTTAYCQ